MFGRTEVGGATILRQQGPWRLCRSREGAPPPNQPPAAPHPPHEPPAAPAMQSNSGGAAATGSDTTEADRPDAVVPTVRPGIAAAKRRTDPLQWAKLSASTAFTDLKWFVTGKRLTPVICRRPSPRPPSCSRRSPRAGTRWRRRSAASYGSSSTAGSPARTQQPWTRPHAGRVAACTAISRGSKARSPVRIRIPRRPCTNSKAP